MASYASAWYEIHKSRGIDEITTFCCSSTKNSREYPQPYRLRNEVGLLFAVKFPIGPVDFALLKTLSEYMSEMKSDMKMFYATLFGTIPNQYLPFADNVSQCKASL